MKVLAATSLFALAALISCEPPAPRNQYLPPGQSPSNAYLPPNGQQSASGFTKEAAHQQSPSSTYGAPAEASVAFPSPQAQYSAPSSAGNHQQALSPKYGAPAESPAAFSNPSAQYGAPSGHGSAGGNHPQAPSSTYGAPAENVAASQNPSAQYGAPSRHRFSAGNRQEAPSSAYGAPAETSAAFPQEKYGAPAAGNDGYSSFHGGNQEENHGPAKYDFQYDVQDFQSGQDFGHKESRDGDKTVGRYYVLLPDGRKQIVEYEADEEGYHPIISHEDTGAGAGAGNSGGLGGGYDNNAQENGY